MDYRAGRFWVILAASAVVWATLVGAGVVHGANSPPLADSWTITSSGKAESSGELLFRVGGQAGTDPVEVTVFVLSGTNETGVASSIRRALTTQLDARRYNISAGEGANVMVTGDGRNDSFSVELIDSDVENVRVSVHTATPAAPPTVPQQGVPANPPQQQATPSSPGDAAPRGPGQAPSAPGNNPTESQPPAPGQSGQPSGQPAVPPAQPSSPPAQPESPPAQPSAPPAQPSAPPDQRATGEASPAGGGAGAPASAPPPPPGNAG